ncbi:MAG: tRNA 4-thiouridine(8) synthase ThiI [Desulfarculus sp.]|nr:MAG: tRNA 4-thiouridine(8) synthase ThiI [Desulfarculus sp.]
MNEHRRPRALGIFSGGLDSMLACLLLRRAGVEVEAVTFQTPFFGPERARRSARHIGVPLRVAPVGPVHLEIVKNPPHGYGSNLNPCIDCHAFMFSQAGQILRAEGFDFLFSGEVLGQRPMSQNRQALALVAKLSGCGGLILRPLSAQNLPPTAMEAEGLVDREKLGALSGRSRKPQMALAAELGVTDYPAPAGGCLLTEPGFSRRLRDLLEHQPGAGVEEVELLKHGRHLRLSPRAKLVVGRNQADNQALEQAAPPGALRLRALGAPGPLGLYLGPPEAEDLRLAAAILAGYGKAAPGEEVRVQVEEGPVISVEARDRRLAAPLLL